MVLGGAVAKRCRGRVWEVGWSGVGGAGWVGRDGWGGWRTGAMRRMVVTLSRKAERAPVTRQSSSISRRLFPPLRARGETAVKRRSNSGQTVVKQRSNQSSVDRFISSRDGQTAVKKQTRVKPRSNGQTAVRQRSDSVRVRA